VGTDRKPVAPEKPPEIAAVIEQGGVLLPKGKFVLTPAAEYLHSSATNVTLKGSALSALNIGLFEVSKLSRDMVTPRSARVSALPTVLSSKPRFPTSGVATRLQVVRSAPAMRIRQRARAA